MKLKVLVLGLNLKRNKVAVYGEIIDSSELPNPEIVEQLMEGEHPYVEEHKDKKAEAAKKAELKAARKLKVEEFNKLDLEDLLKFAEDNKIVISTKAKAKKETAIKEIIEAQEVE